MTIPNREELDGIYSAQWVAHDFAPLLPEFQLVARAIKRQFPEATALLDVGCGPGFLIEGWLACTHATGAYHDALGLEGSVHCRNYAPSMRALEKISLVDLRSLDRLADVRRYEEWTHAPDIIVCTEVAEHIEEEHAERLVRLLCEPMCPIVFTAAPPGQDGHHHVNCQDGDYWHRLFATFGATLDYTATGELRKRWTWLKRLGHMRPNLMCFR